MSDAKVRAVPFGSKRCPNCQGLVKGPRTLLCPHDGCGHAFGKKVVKPTSKGHGKPGRPRKNVAVPVTQPKAVVIPDPFTFNEVASNVCAVTGVAFQNAVGVRRAFAIFPQPNNFVKVMKYINKTVQPEAVSIPNVVAFA